jgi:hypothetical protein
MKRALAAGLGLLALAWGCSDSGGADGTAAEGRERSADVARAGDDQAASGDLRGAEGEAPLAAGDSTEEREARQGDTEQAESDAGQSDLEQIAEGRGWTLEEAQLYRAKSEAAGKVSERLYNERSDVFVGGAVGPEPSDAPRMYIKGPADEQVYEIVGEAPFEIRVIDGQPYSRIEIDERQSALMQVLLALGFLNAGVGTDIQREGLMEATVQRTAGAPDSADEIFAALPAPLRERTSITLVDDPVFTYD